MNRKKDNVKINEGIEIKGLIITVIVLTLIVLTLYGLTIGAQKLGWFDIGYTKPEILEAAISYENIQAGTTFTRKDTEYYVLFADYESEDTIFLSSLANLYTQKEEKLPLYSVNLGDGINKNIIAEISNTKAQKASDLKINGHTLIRVKNGKNIKYIEGDEAIKKELGV